MHSENLFDGADTVYRYSRAQAIADGVLVDVTDTAKEAGFRFPVALTRTLWEQWIVPVPGMEEDGQSETGRLWDVLTVLHFTIACSKASSDRILFTVLFRTPEGTDTVELKSLCGPGDDAEPVLTIMLPEED